MVAPTGPALAQSVHAVLLRDTRSVDAAFADRVDAALVASLKQDAGLDHTEISPVPWSDVALAAGCEGRTKDCMQRVASTVDADVVIVRTLEPARRGAQLTLVSYAPGGQAPAESSAYVAGHGDALEGGVRAGVRALYGIAEPDVPAPLHPHVVMRAAGYGMVTGGATLLVGSLATGVASLHADGNAEPLATTSKLLLGVGFSAALVGTLLVLIDRFGHAGDSSSGATASVDRPVLDVAVLREGAVLAFNGTWEAP